MGYIEQGSVLAGLADRVLEAPCIFCGYRGANYWQRGTHPEGCPWHLGAGGIEARRERLGTIVRALYRAQVLGSLDETMRRESPAFRPGRMYGLTRRERSILRFALHRFINAAYEHATAAGQDKQKRFYREGAVSAFLADAADAEKLLGKIAED